MKIGKLVQKYAQEIFDCVDDAELSRLMDKDYSKKVFGITYPFCRESKLIKKDAIENINNHKSYYKEIYSLLGKDLKITNDWYNEGSKKANNKNTDKFLNYLLKLKIIDKSLKNSYLLKDKEIADFQTRQEQIYQLIKARRGQEKFKKDLLEKHENKCAVTRSSVVEVLEAAHIIPHAKKEDYSVKNGLLLRSDIHVLFDKGLVRISNEGKIKIDDSLNGSEYQDYHDNRLPSSYELSKEKLEKRNLLLEKK